jgi:hypothetical protein
VDVTKSEWEMVEHGHRIPVNRKLRVRWWWYAIAFVAWMGVMIFILSGCDTGARKDLPDDQQTIDESEAVVVANPDGFPNVTHKCLQTTGFWTTTQGNVWIVYEDPQCGGTGQMLVFSNISGRTQAGDSEP